MDSVTYRDDQKGKHQSVDASLTVEWKTDTGYDHIDLVAWGENKEQAKQSLLRNLFALQEEVRLNIKAIN